MRGFLVTIKKLGEPQDSHCPGTVPGILWLLTRAAPIGCDPSMPVLDEQALTNRPVSSSANATSDIVIFFFIIAFLFVVLPGKLLRSFVSPM
jgi:hypothetical protein